jgi:enhancing lycopene biosynthesis protein 2
MSDRKKIAVVLAGCGVYDGAEIHEATLTLLAINRENADYQCFAPDVKQAHVINHLTGNEMPESRNVLIESARIARGNIKPVNQFKVADFDAIVFPGGFGVAKNLCTFAFDGADCTVDPDVRKAVNEVYAAGKPIGAMCIAPAMVAKILDGVKVTIGDDRGTAAAISKMGGIHVDTGHAEVVIDRKNKIVTSPCYMLDANIGQIADGTENVIKNLIRLM